MQPHPRTITLLLIAICVLGPLSCGGGAGGSSSAKPSFDQVMTVAKQSAALRACTSISKRSHPIALVPGLQEWNDVVCTGRLGPNAVVAWYRFGDAKTALSNLQYLNLGLSKDPYLISGAVVVQSFSDNGPNGIGNNPGVAQIPSQLQAACRCGQVKQPSR